MRPPVWVDDRTMVVAFRGPVPTREALMARGFTEFLTAEGLLTPEQLAQQIRRSLEKAREPIGSIAFSYGLLSSDDIDLILEEQKREHRQFGEIAAALGMLTRAQVEALVAIQTARNALGSAEAIILSGIGAHGTMLAALGRFLAGSVEEKGERRSAA